MAEDRNQRRLAAILAADVVGYSRLMGFDERGTLSAFKVHRRELVDAKIAEHQGRIVKLTGDGFLVEFASVVNAVACAAEFQRKMRERNAGVPADRRIEFRIGINLGDIIIEDDDIFGDGVNIAARIESIARRMRPDAWRSSGVSTTRGRKPVWQTKSNQIGCLAWIGDISTQRKNIGSTSAN
ncbi:MAG: adenylate/guanylate cyclase domain-containing protein [Mesorhizobium sp.]|nr:MAG: adenylate/guanylate cyclase domain-containing protein [Mesorhizobium sp.]TJU95709.1 MAG: adenylate/guanylate cyclase domain-containing protein [Mesorhizobium sp.]